MKPVIVKIILVLALVVNIADIGTAEENTQDQTPEQLQKIIITPNRFSQKFQNSTGEISIITKEDIENSGAEILLDVFRTIKGVVVRDYYGNGARSSIDIRGFGEASNSNTLVLVDGRRVNTPDLSGVDWMQIPLDRVERIEILHGGTGSVLYGDNAVGGVVNIITKSGKTQKPKFSVYNSAGSYNMNKQSISCDGATENLSYSFTSSHFDTNGYRQNSEYRSSDFGAKLKYNLNSSLSLKLNSNYHEADLGLPGPLNKEEFATLSRRDSKASERDNNVGEKDYYTTVGLEGITFNSGILNVDFSFRRRTSVSYWPNWWTPTISDTLIDTFSLTPNYTCTLDIFGKPNKLIVGMDFYKTDTKLNDYDTQTDTKSKDNDIDKNSLGVYASDSFNMTDKLSLEVGFRQEYIEYGFNYVDLTGTYSNICTEEKRKEEAYKAGLVYVLNPDTQLFCNASKNFRSPLTDEFLYYMSVAPWDRQLNTGLSTQTAFGFDAGLRHAFNQYLRMDFTMFNMDIDNEIYYDPVTFKNDNYEKTRHQGLNLQVDFLLTKRISVFANWMYTRARFRNGTYNNNTIPMVPLNKASAGINLGFWENINVIPVINFVGRRYMISDQANAAGKLDSYITADLRISYKKQNFEFFFNINNMFDRKYCEYAVTNSTATAVNYYPSPGRNFALGVKLEF
ncbi:MAG: TonB-dependent receptor [Candidatus Omnitrophica bacterium]|nr:TonB-dependent receptor [Candidatus Omnitrophota bacterium]MDD5352311.1 TonB-dependent receptor [Candidatus Omnitrophota bacterium]MDD5549909.1 TonB-dependent receptor [Candidatus Omnitrophota bacterium]